MSSVEIDIAVEAGAWPDESIVEGWTRRAVDALFAELKPSLSATGTELSVTFTDDEHIRTLNLDWRRKDKPTNVLSFPAYPAARSVVLPPLLGDVVIAFETTASEAAADGKALEDHTIHLIVHGALHLIGYDHENDEDAEEMEAVERRVLARLAIADPYA